MHPPRPRACDARRRGAVLSTPRAPAPWSLRATPCPRSRSPRSPSRSRQPPAAPAGGVLLTGLAVLAGQLSIGWSNDLLDRSRDVAAGRSDKPLATGAADPRTVRRATWLAVAGLRAAVPGQRAARRGRPPGRGRRRLGLQPRPEAHLGVTGPVRRQLRPAHRLHHARPAGAPWPPPWAVAAGALLGRRRALPQRGAGRRRRPRRRAYAACRSGSAPGPPPSPARCSWRRPPRWW